MTSETLTPDDLALAATGAQLAIAWWKKAEGSRTKYAKDEIAKYTRLIEKIDGPLLTGNEAREAARKIVTMADVRDASPSYPLTARASAEQELRNLIYAHGEKIARALLRAPSEKG